MTPAEFKGARADAGLPTQQAAAIALESDLRTVRRWENGERAVPGALRCMARLRQLGFPAHDGAAD